MTSKTKNRLLHQLNFLKSIGYEYMDDISLNQNNSNNTRLPNNLVELEAMSKNCHLCDLSKNRTNVLYGYGNIQSKIMIIQMSPSQTQDLSGEFYSSRSGHLLEKMIKGVLNVNIQELYITNIVKCKTQDNINEQSVHICKDYLMKQIELIKPKLIIALGEVCYSHLLNNQENFAKVRGTVLKFMNIDMVPIFEPSYILRNPTMKKEAYYDMLMIKNLMEKM